VTGNKKISCDHQNSKETSAAGGDILMLGVHYHARAKAGRSSHIFKLCQSVKNRVFSKHALAWATVAGESCANWTLSWI